MHGSVFCVSFVAIAVEFVAHNHTPVLFIAVTLGLEEALTLMEGIFLFAVVLAVVLNDLLLVRCIVVESIRG